MDEADPRAALAALIERHGESYAALSRMLGRNPAYLQQFVQRGSPRRLAEADRRVLAGYFRVDEALLGAPQTSGTVNGITVPRIDAVASAGPGGLVEEDRITGGQLFDPALIRGLGVDLSQLSLITAQGESMLPTICPGDLLLVDRGDRRPDSRGGIYVLRADGLLRVKRVARTGRRLSISSDNPAFADEESGEAELIGRVVWLSRALG